MIDGHGDDAYRYTHIKHNFSSNIYAEVQHTELMKHLTEATDCIRNYPEPEPFGLEQLLCHHHHLPPQWAMVCNGATEAIYLIAHCHQHSHSAIVVPTFREYQDACRLHQHTISFCKQVGEMPPHAQLLWLCNPNNPTGETTDASILRQMMEDHHDTLFVVDQAYAPYTDVPLLNEHDVATHSNLIILQSMTKQFAVPGLRIGYILAHPKVIDRLRLCRVPWTVNALAIEAAHYLLAHQDDYTIHKETLHSEITRVAHALEALGITHSDTRTNFALFTLPPHREAKLLKDYLAETHQLLIRDASNFETLNSRHFRIAAQSAEANDLLIKGIREWIYS